MVLLGNTAWQLASRKTKKEERESGEGEGRREERTNREGWEKGEPESGKNKNKPTFYVHLTAIIIFQLNEW